MDNPDFKAIKARVPIRELMEKYQVALDGDLGACPFCGTNKSFRLTPEKNSYQCFSCNDKGNVLEFVSRKDKISLKDAGLKLMELFPLDQPTTKEDTQTKTITVPANAVVILIVPT